MLALMRKLWRAWAIGWLAVLGATAPARAQADADFVVVRDWTPVGSVTSRAVADTILLTSGTILSSSSYGDVVFRFDYRLPSPQAKASVLVRSHIGSDGGAREYAVALDGIGSSGQLSATALPLVETRFSPRAGSGRAWTSCEIRVAGGHLTVRVGGDVIAEGDRIEAPDGRLGFRVGQEGVELRRMRVARPAEGSTAPPSSFHPELPRADEQGVELPTIVKSTPPSYPAALRSQRISGEVRLAVEVTAEGRPGDMHVMSSAHPDLIAPAIACVRQWRFRPARKDGVVTGTVVTVEVSFKLQR